MNTIVVGIDGGATSKIAARQAIDVGAAMGATVHFVTAVRKHEVETVRSGADHWIVDNIESAKEHVRSFLKDEDVDIDHSVAAVMGAPGKALVAEATRLDADLIVVGNRDMDRIGRLLGSVGSDVSHHAPCSVLIVKTV